MGEFVNTLKESPLAEPDQSLFRAICNRSGGQDLE
jgi:hypothetical protein